MLCGLWTCNNSLTKNWCYIVCNLPNVPEWKWTKKFYFSLDFKDSELYRNVGCILWKYQAKEQRIAKLFVLSTIRGHSLTTLTRQGTVGTKEVVLRGGPPQLIESKVLEKISTKFGEPTFENHQLIVHTKIGGPPQQNWECILPSVYHPWPERSLRSKSSK